MIRHHPDEIYLAAYANGQLAEAESLVIASHVALCPLCRHAVADFEAVGGALLDDVAPMALSDQSLQHVLDQLDNFSAPVKKVHKPVQSVAGLVSDNILPSPLRYYIEKLDASTQWQPVMNGLDQINLSVGQHKKSKTKLLRIRSGIAMPQHTHKGEELTLVLDGAFRDERGYFGRGDLAMTDHDVDHRPIADDKGDCICLVVTTDNLSLTGPLARFLNPFLRF